MDIFSLTKEVAIRPLPVSGVMGHVKDTQHVRDLEETYGYKLVGFTARWKVVNGQYRVEVYDGKYWRGVYPMYKADLEIYDT